MIFDLVNSLKINLTKKVVLIARMRPKKKPGMMNMNRIFMEVWYTMWLLFQPRVLSIALSYSLSVI